MGLVPPAAGLPRGAAGGLRRGRGAADLRRGDHRVPTGRGRGRGLVGVRPDLWCFGKVIGGRAAGRRLRRPGRRAGGPRPAGTRLPGRHPVGEPAGHGGRAWPSWRSCRPTRYAGARRPGSPASADSLATVLDEALGRRRRHRRRRASAHRPGAGGRPAVRPVLRSRGRARRVGLRRARRRRRRPASTPGSSAPCSTGAWRSPPGPTRWPSRRWPTGSAEFDRTLDVRRRSRRRRGAGRTERRAGRSRCGRGRADPGRVPVHPADVDGAESRGTSPRGGAQLKAVPPDPAGHVGPAGRRLPTRPPGPRRRDR